MSIEIFQERVRRVQAVRWTGTESAADSVRSLIPGVLIGTDGDGAAWMTTTDVSVMPEGGTGQWKVPVDWWVVTDGVSVEVLTDELFRRKYEAVAP